MPDAHTSDDPDASPGIWPYALPYLGFAAVLALRDVAPDGAGTTLAALAQVAVPGGLLLYFGWFRGAYPELARQAQGRLAWLPDVGVGLSIAALWVGPYLLFPGLPRPAADPAALDPAALALRFVGFALVTPFMEELFVRSFLLRFLDVFDTDADFRSVPIGRFAWRSFIGTVLWFTVTHQAWEWIVALPTGIVFNLWLYRRRRMGSLVLTHAVANGAIFALVLLAGPDHPELWTFL